MILRSNLPRWLEGKVYKIIAESSHFLVNNTDVNIDDYFLEKKIYLFPPPQDSWYSDMRILLGTKSAPYKLEPNKRRASILKSVAY